MPCKKNLVQSMTMRVAKQKLHMSLNNNKRVFQCGGIK